VTSSPSSARIALAWLPAALYVSLIWWLSSQQIVLPIDRIPMRDKGVHFVEFGVLGACFAEAVWVTWPRRGLRGAMVAWVFTTASGLLDELHQVYVPGRSADIGDLLADALGAVAGVLFLYALRAYLRARGARGAPESISRA